MKYIKFTAGKLDSGYFLYEFCNGFKSTKSFGFVSSNLIDYCSKNKTSEVELIIHGNIDDAEKNTLINIVKMHNELMQYKESEDLLSDSFGFTD